ncbi:TonB-dependent receptor plug domain-containing protein [Marinobacter salinisoli]|uniref:TonB-dependent receptor plug domain-containing protein n=1 Tax=Marinobacter salinisoli TaxID=2769486 RepID=UPI001D18EDA1|nr:TonB-dependent receptor [Marinobacter salinisoli]
MAIAIGFASSQVWADDKLAPVYPSLITADGEFATPTEVLTTTRLRQSKLKVPGSTTVITGDMIRQLGIMNLVEVFRLVPGMVVGEYGSNNPVTSYHGTSQYEQRRLQVQIDGRTAYRASLADVDWIAMPVALENIERIEVSRGPNSAAYGINAFLGSINIITRSPEDTAGVELYGSAGSRDHLRAFSSVGDAGRDGSWRLSYEKRKSAGFDRQVDGGERLPFHDGYDINNVNLDGIVNFSNLSNLELRAGVLGGVNEEDRLKSGNFGAITNPDIEQDNYYLQARFNGATSSSHFYHLQASFQNRKRQQSWTISSADEEFPEALRPLLGEEVFFADLNEDATESRLEFELQDTLILGSTLKLVSGLGYREDRYESETFFNGTGHNYQSRIFANAEYSPFEWVTFNAGGNWEKTTTTGEDYFSPRVASNFIFGDDHVVRFVFSRAVRTPDAFEQDPDWSYTFRNVSEPYESLEGLRIPAVSPNNDLSEEKITSREVSYFGQFHFERALMSVEVRYFNDYLRDMISGFISPDEWNLDNNVALEQEGVELEAALQLSGTMLRATYGYLDQEGRYTGAPDQFFSKAVDLLGRLSAQHSGSFAWIQELPFQLTSSAAFYMAEEVRDTRFKRADFRLARKVDHQKYSYMLALTLQHYLERAPWISPDNIIADHNQYFIEAGIRF